MEENWIKAFVSTDMIKAEIAREKLDQNGIPAVIVNKQDSFLYPFFGMYEVHVPARDLTTAQTLLSDEGTFTDAE